ncbi:MAG: hypothetical protein HGA38_02730 [Candidatus Moranbacteria bacterium]|nr:hypothetical protein [Candidatus Moranbacteria bacterium]NTW46253.1 hypothetical protein [Candidatus Moranbacteria bacterium]
MKRVESETEYGSDSVDERDQIGKDPADQRDGMLGDSSALPEPNETEFIERSVARRESDGHTSEASLTRKKTSEDVSGECSDGEREQ